MPPLRWGAPENDISHLYTEADNILGIHIMDEPDTKDYDLGGLGKSSPELLNRINEIRTLLPKTPLYLAIGSTYRPAAWHVYYPLADVCIGHRYGIPGGFDGSLGHIQIARRVALAAAPRPTYNILTFFAWTPDRDPSDRLPVVEETYLQAITALSKGAKGIAYYRCFSSGTLLGGDSDPVLWEGVKGINCNHYYSTGFG